MQVGSRQACNQHNSRFSQVNERESTGISFEMKALKWVVMAPALCIGSHTIHPDEALTLKYIESGHIEGGECNEHEGNGDE